MFHVKLSIDIEEEEWSQGKVVTGGVWTEPKWGRNGDWHFTVWLSVTSLDLDNWNELNGGDIVETNTSIDNNLDTEVVWGLSDSLNDER